MSDTTPDSPTPPSPERASLPPVAPAAPVAPQQPAAGQPPVYAQPPAYAQPGYPAPGYGYPPQPKTNIFAILSLIFAFVFSVLGIVFGHVALSQIKRTGENGHGLALAGLILGYVFTGLVVIFFVIYFIAIAALIGTAGVYGYTS